MTPAFQKLFWFSGLSRYSPMKKVAKMAPMASQTKNPAHPKLLTSGRIVPGVDPEPCSQRHKPSSKTQPNGGMKMKIVIYLQLVDVSACSIFGNYESQLVPVEVVSLASR